MTFALALLLVSTPPRTLAQAPPAPQASPAPARPCTPRPRFAAVAIDPVAPLTVNTGQHFAVALRVTADGGYGWRLSDTLAANAPVRAEGVQTLSDVALRNLDRKPGDAPAVGGEATQLFLFTAANPGSATLTFGLFQPGSDAPQRTTAFTVHVSPDVSIAC